MVRKVSKHIRKLLSRPKAAVFLMFLVISFFIWFLITLSGTYVSALNFKVIYTDIPQDKLILGTPKSKVEASVQATGFKILSYRLFKRSVALSYPDFRSQGKRSYMLDIDVESAINNQYKSLIVSRLNLDTLRLTLGENKKKYVPVVSRVMLSFEEDFEISDSLSIEPDSIWVRGPEDIVDKVDRVHTIVKNYKKVNDNIQTAIALFVPDSLKKLEYECSEVTVHAQVERFSEELISVDVEVVNLPENISIKLYPDQVKILCKAPISVLKNISASDFRVVCDFKNHDGEAPYLIPQVVKKPEFVSFAKLKDHKIEYLTKTKEP